MTGCEFIEDEITPYVDGEGSQEVRDRILEHIHHCQDCHDRVEAEARARHVLRAHASVARSLGEVPEWTPRVFRLGQPAFVVARPAVAVLTVATTLVIALLLALRPQPVQATGVIGDSRCGLHHRYTDRFGVDERTCTQNCVLLGASLVLISDGGVYAITNQNFPGLSDLASARVAVSGTIHDGAITLLRVSLTNE